jgi:hypothetical protein
METKGLMYLSGTTSDWQTVMTLFWDHPMAYDILYGIEWGARTVFKTGFQVVAVTGSSEWYWDHRCLLRGWWITLL